MTPLYPVVEAPLRASGRVCMNDRATTSVGRATMAGARAIGRRSLFPMARIARPSQICPVALRLSGHSQKSNDHESESRESPVFWAGQSANLLVTLRRPPSVLLLRSRGSRRCCHVAHVGAPRPDNLRPLWDPLRTRRRSARCSDLDLHRACRVGHPLVVGDDRSQARLQEQRRGQVDRIE